MDNSKEGGHVNHPLILYGTNYDYCNARMVSFFSPWIEKLVKLSLMDGPFLHSKLKIILNLYLKRIRHQLKMKFLLVILMSIILFTMELTKTPSGSLTHALMLMGHGKLLK